MVGATGASPAVQTSWTRAEAACAALHRGDAYFTFLHSSTNDAGVQAPAPPPVAPGQAGPTGLGSNVDLHL